MLCCSVAYVKGARDLSLYELFPEQHGSARQCLPSFCLAHGELAAPRTKMKVGGSGPTGTHTKGSGALPEHRRERCATRTRFCGEPFCGRGAKAPVLGREALQERAAARRGTCRFYIPQDRTTVRGTRGKQRGDRRRSSSCGRSEGRGLGQDPRLLEGPLESSVRGQRPLSKEEGSHRRRSYCTQRWCSARVLDLAPERGTQALDPVSWEEKRQDSVLLQKTRRCCGDLAANTWCCCSKEGARWGSAAVGGGGAELWCQ
ncbi:hypothetical protein NDU88_002958 [Pleurodeles waltl]|uniref:Uncharacterized protein n=1 Tax=Pleurodeles waltl TaxID=8319 RepID=A0AAV7T3V5_PLEWA|nr:hypothetical protein NDU88_002958 [Pleurodeles waltl]